MNSLLSRLILLIVLALLPAFVLQLGAELLGRPTRAMDGFREASRVAALANAEQEQIGEAAREVLATWGEMAPSLMADPPACDRRVTELIAAFPRYQELEVVGPDGQPVCGVGAGPAAPPVATGSLLGLAAAGPYTHGNVLEHFTAPFAGANGAVAGTVVLGLSLDWLQGQLEQLALPPDSVLCLIDSTGTIVARRPDGVRLRGHPAPEPIRSLIYASRPGVTEALDGDGVDRVFAYIPLAAQPHGLALAVGLSRERLFSSFDAAHRRLMLSLALGLLVAIACALIGANALVRRPFVRLLGAAEQMRQGDLAARVGMTPDGSEFGRLSAALDATAAALETREGALRDALATAELTRLALGESETRLRLALDSAEVSVWEIDLRHQRVWLDHRAEELSRGLLPGNTWVGLRDPALRAWLATIKHEDWDKRAAALRSAMSGEHEHIAIEYRFRDPDGVWRWIAERGAVVSRDRTGAPLRIIGISRDVTEQRDAAVALEREVADRTAALAESESRFRSIFDATFQFTALAAPDGTLLEANRALLEFVGRPAEALRGLPLSCALSGDSDAAVAARIRQETARAAAGSFVRCELELPGAGNRQAVVDFSLKPVLSPAGNVILLVAEARDITERSRLQVQLAQAQKMEAVGQLTGGVAHDFNNLLQAVTGNLDLIGRSAETRGDLRLLRFVANAQRAVQRGARLTQQLLSFSRRQNLRPERVLVSRLMAETMELLRRGAGTMVEVQTRAAADLWSCNLDPAQFESALLNLVINARDAMPSGGRLTIATCNTTLAAPAAATLDIPPGDYVRVDVIDTGTGIAPENLPRIFEPFFTTKEVGKGSGLGLAMVHGFARQSGGAVAIDTELGRGTTITLYLPRDPGELPAEPAEDPGAEMEAPLPADRPVERRGPMRTEEPTVLVVEDNPEVLDTMQFALVDAGYRVLTARDGVEALEVLDSLDTPIDVLLCDMMLPGPNTGDEVADMALARRPGLRVLLISGYASEALAQRGRDEADFELLAKPFAQTELLRRLAELTAQPA